MDLKDTLCTVQRFNAFFEELNLKEITQSDTEEREMVMVVKFIKSGFLEKQLKAIDEIKKLILISDPSNEYRYLKKKKKYFYYYKIVRKTIIPPPKRIFLPNQRN